MFLNLARNAVEAGAHRLRFAAARDDATIAIEVSDDGHGLPPKARENLFRPFFGSARPGGSGLGLAIARELVRAHGGELSLASSTGAGTVFRLTLPAAAIRVRASATWQSSTAPAQSLLISLLFAEEKQRAEKALPQNPCHLGAAACEITAQMFAGIPLLFAVTGLSNESIE